MDLSHLDALGRVAGIGGIALGAVVLLVRPLIGIIGGVPAPQRARVVNLIALGCFSVGVIGIVAWSAGAWSGGQSVVTAGERSPGVISGGEVSIGAPLSPAAITTQNQAATAPGAPPPVTPPNASVHTQGAQSPGIISGGSTHIQYSAPLAPATPTPAPASPSVKPSPD
jgi:hypothetical protein